MTDNRTEIDAAFLKRMFASQGLDADDARVERLLSVEGHRRDAKLMRNALTMFDEPSDVFAPHRQSSAAYPAAEEKSNG